jgi:hypothetical protein
MCFHCYAGLSALEVSKLTIPYPYTRGDIHGSFALNTQTGARRLLETAQLETFSHIRQAQSCSALTGSVRVQQGRTWAKWPYQWGAIRCLRATADWRKPCSSNICMLLSRCWRQIWPVPAHPLVIGSSSMAGRHKLTNSGNSTNS